MMQKYLNVIREKVDWEIAAWKGGKTEGGLESQNYVRKLENGYSVLIGTEKREQLNESSKSLCSTTSVLKHSSEYCREQGIRPS